MQSNPTFSSLSHPCPATKAKMSTANAPEPARLEPKKIARLLPNRAKRLKPNKRRKRLRVFDPFFCTQSIKILSKKMECFFSAIYKVLGRQYPQYQPKEYTIQQSDHNLNGSTKNVQYQITCKKEKLNTFKVCLSSKVYEPAENVSPKNTPKRLMDMTTSKLAAATIRVPIPVMTQRSKVTHSTNNTVYKTYLYQFHSQLLVA